MSWTDLFPGCSVRWEDERPFEVEVHAAIAREPATPIRIRHLLARAGWSVTLAAFAGVPGKIARAMILEAERMPVRPAPRIPS